MTRTIKNDAEAVKVAAWIIVAQDRLLSAYRLGTHSAGTAIDILREHRPRLEAWLDKRAEMNGEDS